MEASSPGGTKGFGSTFNPAALVALVPGAATVYLGFHAGGFFPAAVGVTTVALLALTLLLLMLPARPWAPVSMPWAVLVAALVLFGGLQMVSATWSNAPGRAVLEFNRTLLYLLAAVVGALAAGTPQARRWMVRGLAAGFVVICAAGFISRTLPDVLHPTLTNEPDRLSYPVTYWNAMGLVAALAVVLCAGLASDAREGRMVRAVAAAALPLAAATLLLTFSRGPIGVCIAGLVVFVVVARPAGLLGLLAAAGVPVAAALAATYAADALGSKAPQSTAAIHQGARVAAAVAVCCVVAGGLRLLTVRIDDHLLRRPPLSERTRRTILTAIVSVAVVTAIGLAAGGVVSDQYDRFVHAQPLHYSDQRDRLLDAGNNGRLGIWDVALQRFRAHPLRGDGAGTFAIAWNRRRPAVYDVSDGHSLYLETLAELGIIGIGLLAVALLAALGGLLARLRGARQERTLDAALFAAAAMWFVHAGVDWDWEMPVTTLWLFAAAGATLAAAPGRGRLAEARPGRFPRVLAGVACLVVAVTPVRVVLSQHRLDASAAAFRAGDCARATSAALRSLDALAVRAEPWEVIGYCDARAARTALAERAFGEARRQDPGNWELAYGLAIVRAAGGHDPRPAIAEALRENPREPDAIAFASRVGSGDPRQWRRAARDAPLPIR